MYFPNFFMPKDDELFLSYFMRMAYVNGVGDFYQFLDFWYGKKSMISYDAFKYFKDFYRLFEEAPDMAELFLRVSTLGYEALGMTKEQQLRYAVVLNGKEKCTGGVIPGLIETLKVCPECFKEDSGEDEFGYDKPCFHRSHQLDGVNVCYKHGCKLLEFNPGKTSRRSTGNYKRIFELDNYSECTLKLSLPLEILFAKSASLLLEADLNTDCVELREFLHKKVLSVGYNGLYTQKFLDDLGYSEFAEVLANSNFLRKPGSTPTRNVLYLLLHIYKGDIWAFIKEFQNRKKETTPEIYNGLECISKEDSILKTYKCDICNDSMIMTDYGIKVNAGCPSCNGKESGESFYGRIIPKIENGDYELKEASLSDNKVMVKHRVCGRTMSVVPSKFVFEGKRCSCHRYVSEEEAKERVAAVPGYRLVTYNGVLNKVEIFHEGCGHKFITKFGNFLRRKHCLYCQNSRRNNDSFLREVRAVVGDEYEVLNDYEGFKTKVRMKHCKCGYEFEVMPRVFMSGTRCPACHNKNNMSYAELCDAVNKYTSGHYAIVEKLRGVRHLVRNNQNGETMTLTGIMIKQEIFRPTPSDKFVLNDEEEKSRIEMLKLR